MTIHFAGSEPESYNRTPASNQWSTSSSRYRTAYGRGAFQASSTQPLEAAVAAFGPTVWFSAQWYIANISSVTSDLIYFGLGGTNYLRLRTDSTPSQATIQSLQSGSWTTLGNWSGTPTTGAVTKLDIEIVINSSTGSVRVWSGGSLIAEVTNVNTQGDNPGTTLDSFSIRSVASSSNGWSEVIFADEDTRLMNVHTLYPASAGALAEMEGDYTNISHDGSVNSSSVYSASAGEYFLFAHPESFAGGENISAVVLAARAAADGSSPTRLKAVQGNAGSYYEGASVGVSGLGPYRVVMDTAPDGGAWDAAKINGSQFGWRSGS